MRPAGREPHGELLHVEVEDEDEPLTLHLAVQASSGERSTRCFRRASRRLAAAVLRREQRPHPAGEQLAEHVGVEREESTEPRVPNPG